MRILIDTSTLYSAMTHEGRVHDLLHLIIKRHEVVLSDYIVEELKRNIKLKLSGPKRENALLDLEIVVSLCCIITKEQYIHNLPAAKELISLKDSPVLACGMLDEIDYLLTSDKEFLKLKMKKIISPNDAWNIMI
jgi:predicted nucleic acid-binding protein